MVEHADSEDLRRRGKPVSALPVLVRGRGISGGMVVLCAAPSYVTPTGVNAIFSGAAKVKTLKSFVFMEPAAGVEPATY
jgi:hypothetical protein